MSKTTPQSGGYAHRQLFELIQNSAKPRERLHAEGVRTA